MEFEISTPAVSDGPRMAEIHVRSMQVNPLLHAQFPSDDSIRQFEEFLTGHYAALVASQDTTRESRALVARHKASSGRVAAFAVWDVPASGQQGGEGPEKLEDGRVKDLDDCRTEYLEHYAALAVRAEMDAMKGEKCYHLTFVCTDPEFQRMGAGEALARAVLRLAQAEGMPVYLESTAEAVRLYSKLDFETVGGFGMKIPKRGATEPTEDYREVCMVWRPAKITSG